MLTNARNPEDLVAIMEEIKASEKEENLELEENFDYTEFTGYNHFC